MLVALSNKKEISAAFHKFSSNLNKKRKIIRLKRYIGYQGGGNLFEVSWLIEHRFWFTLDPKGNKADNRYWCCFGLQDPNEIDHLGIDCESNMPYSGINRRTAGLFAKDEVGNVYLLHDGKIGGSKKGIGKKTFWNNYTGNNIKYVITNKKEPEKLVLIGKVNDRQLPELIEGFVRSVRDIKQGKRSSQSKTLRPNFSEEFFGTRTSYYIRKKFEIDSKHGLIVNRLKNELEELGYNCANSPAIDLYLYNKNRNVTHTFEVKTNTTNSTIYGAIGQLMYHSIDLKHLKHKIMVVPEDFKLKHTKALNGLNINILKYKWKNNKPVFIKFRVFITNL